LLADGRERTAALTILLEHALKRFPVDQKFKVRDGLVVMRMGIADSVHSAASNTVDIPGSMLLTLGTEPERLPRRQLLAVRVYQSLKPWTTFQKEGASEG
jgi:hypothetical protein